MPDALGDYYELIDTLEPLLSETHLSENPSFLKEQSDSQTLKIRSFLTSCI